MRVAGKIFVNYRRDDAKAEAARLHDKLALHFGAANVFMDVDNLLPGERFDLKLQEALAETDIFLAVIGARWQELFEARAASGQRDYVREEIAAALARKIVVIPVPMDRAALPQEESLPPDIRELVLYHKQDVAHESFGRDVQALVSAIDAHRQAQANKAAGAARLAREREQAEIEAARRARQKRRKRPREGARRGKRRRRKSRRRALRDRERRKIPRRSAARARRSGMRTPPSFPGSLRLSWWRLLPWLFFLSPSLGPQVRGWSLLKRHRKHRLRSRGLWPPSKLLRQKEFSSTLARAPFCSRRTPTSCLRPPA